MSVYFQSDHGVIFQEDSLEVLKNLKTESVNMCVTSPPYFGLRDYGVEGQIGLESTIKEYVQRLTRIFEEVRRVLKKDGTLWLNIGDSYNGSGKTGGKGKQQSNKGSLGRPDNRKGFNGLKQKDLIGIPWRVAFALQSNDWYLRQDIIWDKPNVMPESVKDRCTKAHEYIFLLSKSRRYYYDYKAIKEPAKWERWGKQTDVKGYIKGTTETLGKDTRGKPVDMDSLEERRKQGRNKRSVWHVPSKPFKGAHFAVFPPALIEPCILAGCPENGTVLDPFFGSGTTGEVCILKNRFFIGIELNSNYCEIAKNRLEGTSRSEEGKLDGNKG